MGYSMSANFLVRPVMTAVILFTLALAASADNAGSAASFTRGDWAGARYTASGMTGEVMADDVFSIYWNPAGLSELRTRTKLTEDQITEKARSGDVDSISEEDLLNFSESGKEKLFVDVGISASALDENRNAGFVGGAFNLFGGVFGA